MGGHKKCSCSSPETIPPSLVFSHYHVESIDPVNPSGDYYLTEPSELKPVRFLRQDGLFQLFSNEGSIDKDIELISNPNYTWWKQFGEEWIGGYAPIGDAINFAIVTAVYM